MIQIAARAIEVVIDLDGANWGEAIQKNKHRWALDNIVCQNSPRSLHMRITTFEGSAQMKRMTTLLAIGTCLLLTPVGVARAENPHPFTTSGTGQPGSNNGIACGGPNATSTPSGAVNGNGSPFNPTPAKPIEYAGNPGNPTAQPGGVGNPLHAVSQYDVACFQATQMP